jgi:hypothetical protein
MATCGTWSGWRPKPDPRPGLLGARPGTVAGWHGQNGQPRYGPPEQGAAQVMYGQLPGQLSTFQNAAETLTQERNHARECVKRYVSNSTQQSQQQQGRLQGACNLSAD